MDADFNVSGSYQSFEVPFSLQLDCNPPTTTTPFLRGTASSPQSCLSCTNVDLRVYWYGKRGTWLDKVYLEDDVAHQLFPREGQASGSVDSLLIQDAQDFTNTSTFSLIKRLYLVDEPSIGNFKTYHYIEQTLSNALPQLDPNGDGRCKGISTINVWGLGNPTTSDNWIKWFFLDAQPKEVLCDWYVLTDDVPSPSISDAAQSADLGIAAYQSNSHYNELLQPRWISLEQFLGPIAQQSKASGKNFWYVPQLHGAYFVANGQYRSPDGASNGRPPTGNEIQAQVNIALALGAKGIIPYPYGTDYYPGWGGSGAWGPGLVSLSLDANGLHTDHSSNTTTMPFGAGHKDNVYVGYKEKWDSLSSINKKLKLMAPTLLALQWQGTKAWSTNTTWGDWTSPVVTNVSTTEMSPAVLTGQFSKGDTVFLYVTNLRCDYSSNNIDQRDISITLDTRNPRWYITNVVSGDALIAVGGSPFTDRFGPGEGKLYKLVRKNPLSAGKPDALSTNAQRKLVRSLLNGLNMVYGDVNQVWWTSSADNGSTWAVESPVNSSPQFGTRYRNPSIEIFPDNFEAIIAWEAVSNTGVWTHTIQTNLPSYENIESFTTATDQSAAPVITSISYPSDGTEVTMFWKNDVGIRWFDFEVSHFREYGTVDGTTAGSYYPSAASRLTNNNSFDQWCVVWEQRGSTNTIQYAQSKPTSPVTWTPATVVTSNSSEQNIDPVVVIDNDGNSCIAWLYTDGSSYKIKFQRRDLNGDLIANSSIDFPMCPGVIASGPSLTSHRYDASNKNDLGLTWSLSNGGIVCALFNGGTNTWSSPFLLSSTAQAVSLSETKSGESQRYALMLSPSATLYTLQSVVLPGVATPPSIPSLISPADGSTNMPITSTLTWGCVLGAASYTGVMDTDPDFGSDVKIVFTSTSAQASVSLQCGKTYYWHVAATNINGMSDWSATNSLTTINCPPSPHLSWTIYNTHPKLTWNSMGSNMIYKLYRYYCVYGGGDCGFTGQLINTTTSLSYTDNSVVVCGGRNCSPTSTAYYYVTSTDNLNVTSPPSNKAAVNTGNIVWQAGHQEEAEIQPLPSETKLAANYPNPFNPTTKLEYQLAEPGYVRLIISNVLGQEVAQLVNSEHAAGFYSVRWDAASVPSGLYYARIIITDPSAKELYQGTKKMLLMK